MKVTFQVIIFLLTILISGCSAVKKNEDLYQYQGSYVGDNNSVGKVLNRLAYNDELTSFELKTKAAPYGIVLNYTNIEKVEEDLNLKETAIHNATFIFALIKNIDWITFKFDDNEYNVSREKLLKWYRTNFSEYKSEEELRNFIQENINDNSKVEGYFKQ
ncbi:DUF4825 domain-containing protein [Mesobacillus jeotgali]|uniref:DUF4825 domain-containing protein n=1 Tax=Mesobacillus jeotgali TaxID=129985 RepID=UPI000C81D18A|nr:DUF4825 domain-containing protein [Mesobacillus jeotgali]